MKEMMLLFFLAGLVTILDVVAFAPPDNNYTAFRADLRRVRQRLLFSTTPSSYRPKNISPAACWLLSDEECREQDEVVGFATRKGGVVNQGTIKVLVLLCRFKDHESRDLPPASYYEELFNGKGKSEINPIGSIREYLLWSSQGRYNATFDIQPWKTTEETEAYYAGGSFGLLGADAMQEMFKPLLTDLFNSKYDFRPLDSDAWGDLDHLVVIHSGYPAEYGKAECTGNAPEDRIWSQGTAATGSVAAWLSPDYAYSVSNYAILGAFTGLCQGKTLQMDEILHGYGLFDLYDLDENDEQIALGGTGKFGIMSNMHGWNQNGRIPGHMNAFSRIFLGWLEPIEITEDGFYAIQPAELTSQIYAIRKGFRDGEYFLLENRQPYQWDSDWTSSGLVIYRIDDNVNMQKNRGYPGHPNWPRDHYQVSVVQADRKFEIERGVNVGDGEDMWRKGDVLSPGGDFPNTDGISGGQRTRTGIEIEVLSDSQYVMLFKVSGVSQH